MPTLIASLITCPKDLMRFVGDQLEESFSILSDEELIAEVEEYYPDLIEEA